MARYSAPRSWQRWAGTRDELEHAFRSANESLAHWIGEEPQCVIRVVLPQITMSFESIDEFLAVSSFDFVKAKSISADFRQGVLRPSVEISLKAEYPPGASLEVVGDDRVQVDGLRATVSEILDRGRKNPAWLNSYYTFIASLVVGVASAFVLFFAFGNLAAALNWLPKGNE